MVYNGVTKQARVAEEYLGAAKVYAAQVARALRLEKAFGIHREDKEKLSKEEPKMMFVDQEFLEKTLAECHVILNGCSDPNMIEMKKGEEL